VGEEKKKEKEKHFQVLGSGIAKRHDGMICAHI
jgi:hypothetical protein